MLMMVFVLALYAFMVYAARRIEAAPPQGQAQFERFLDMLARIRWLLANRNRV
jgi:hypothetical protein